MSTKTGTILGEIERMREYIRSHRWQFAKTMRAIPHWYTVREWDDCPEFEDFVRFIRAYGYVGYFGKRPFVYLNFDGFKYWTMGAPVEETTVINRAPVEPAYHSALKGFTEMQTPRVDYVEESGNVALQWDMAKGRLPGEYGPCDVIYFDAPWVGGFRTFDERAEVMGKREYSIVSGNITRIINSTDVPVVIQAGKNINLPTPDQTIDAGMHGGTSVMYVFNGTFPDAEPKSTFDMVHYLAQRYDHVGDPFCGYGNTGRIFAENGKMFTMSDHNARCIGYIAMNIVAWTHGMYGETEAP